MIEVQLIEGLFMRGTSPPVPLVPQFAKKCIQPTHGAKSMRDLRDKLLTRNTALLKTIEHLVEQATPQLWHSYGTFPAGTKHTPEHTQMVESLAGMLLPDQLIEELSDDEIGLLILASHYHDLGMVGTEVDNSTVEGRDRVRREHAVSIGDRISHNWRELGFTDPTYAEILALICKGHRPTRINGVATWENLPEFRIVGPNRDVRVRVVSALVYAADELHIGADRAPRREEEFCEILSSEARRHWRRHQAVQGPVIRKDILCFEGSVGSCEFEKDLRQALQKSFQAVKELGDELARTKLEFGPRSIQFIWHRMKIWNLLVADVCSDLVPRTTGEIVEEVITAYEVQLCDAVQIGHLCIETIGGGNLEAEVRESITNFKTREYLIQSDEDEEKLVLNSTPRVAQQCFDAGREADVEDSILLVGGESPEHEHRLYKSAFGRRYVQTHLYPRLQSAYHINIASTPNIKHLRTTLESSPTAARIAQLITPPTSVLVQTDLLEFATIAGTCADLINDPELILKRDYRYAVSKLFEAGAERLPKFLLFIEELAVIQKLSLKQISEVIANGDKTGDDKSGEDKTAANVSITITQQFPIERPEWAIGYLVLASRRADVAITLQNSRNAPFEFKNLNENGLTLPEEPTMGATITIGPGQPTYAPTSTFRARIEFDVEKSALTLQAFRPSIDDSGKPLQIHFSFTEKRGRFQCRLKLIESEVSVGEAVNLHRANIAHSAGKLTLHATIEGKEVVVGDLNGPLGGPLLDTFVERLALIDETIPYPSYFPEELQQALSNCNIDDVKTVFEEHRNTLTKRPTVASVMMRFTTIHGDDYYEEHLGMQPLHFKFNAPMVKAEGISQEEINEKWQKGEESITLEASFREGIYELAQEIRNWTKAPETPFPFGMNEADLQFHYCNTRLIMTFEKVVDRFWYLERRLMVRFREVSKSERYAIERDYWENQGDVARAELLSELFQRAAAEEAKAYEGKLGAPRPQLVVNES